MQAGNHRHQMKLQEAKKMCRENYEFFKAHINEFFAKYPYKFVTIKDKKIIGVYDDFDTAFEKTIRTEELGTFLIQQCLNSADECVNYFYSNNVAFSVV